MSKFKKFYPPILRHLKNFDKVFCNKEVSFFRTKLTFGDFAVFACDKVYFTPKQVESIFFFVRKRLKGIGELRFKSLPLRALSKKGVGSRMGKGKGVVSKWVFCVKAGSPIFEVATNFVESFLSVFFSIRQMFPVKVVFFSCYLSTFYAGDGILRKF